MGEVGEIVRIALPNDSKLGIAITPPKHGVTVRGLKIDKVQNELFVGRISHGDLMLEIGGVQLDGMKFADAVNLIKTLPRPLELTFEIVPTHMKKTVTAKEGGEEDFDKIPSYNVVLDGDKIGFQLDDGSRLGIDGTVVKAVRDQAEEAGIAVGDIVYKVNGTEVLFMSLKQVQKLIKATLPPRSLDFIPKLYLEEVQRMNQQMSAMEKQLRTPIPKHDTQEEKSITEIIKEHRATKIKEGPMYKQGRMVKNWKLRHVVLRVTKLEYFKDARDKIPQGIVDFENCRCTVRPLPSAVKTSSTPGGHLLELAAGDRVLVMSCTTENEKEDWLEALRVAIDASKAVTRQESSLGYNQDPNVLRRDESILNKTFKSLESGAVKRRESNGVVIPPTLTQQLSIQPGDAGQSAVKIEVCALNPFCEVTLGAETFKTPVVRDTVNPVWNQDNKVVFGVVDDDAVIEIRVFDERSFRGSELLSTLTIPLSSLPNKQKIEHTYPLILADRSAHASITMKLEYSKNSHAVQDYPSLQMNTPVPDMLAVPSLQVKKAISEANTTGLTQEEIDKMNEMSEVADAAADDASRIAKQAQELANSLIEEARRKAEMAIEAAQLEAMGQKAAAEEARAAAKLAREQADLQMAAARKAQEELHEAQKRRQLIRSGSTTVNLGGSSGGQSGGFGQFLAYRTMFVKEKMSEEDVRAKMVSDGIDDEQINHFFDGIKDYRAKMAELEQQVETLKRERSMKKREEEAKRTSEPSAAVMLQSGTISSDQEKILRRLLKLERQLKQAGIVVAEDIPYEEAQKKVEEISRRMGEIGSADVTHPDPATQKLLREEYFKLEQDMEKYNGALMLTDEYAAEQERKEREWEEENREENEKALRAIRRMMPVDVKSMSEAQLQAIETTTGKKLSRDVALKFKRTNVLEILRTNPMDLQKNHPSLLDGLRVTGLTVTERRALHLHLREVAETWKSQQKEEMAARKYAWFKSLKDTFKTAVGAYNRHVAQYGPPGNHPYATRDDPGVGCPMIGKQCPLKADAAPAYNIDLGFPEGPVYQQVNVTLSTPDDVGAAAKAELERLKAAKNEQASIEREKDLKEHYKHVKGNTLVLVKAANGACENLSELVDKIEQKQKEWFKKILNTGPSEPSAAAKKAEVAEFDDLIQELRLKSNQFAERSGMYLQGRRNPEKDTPDTRSFHELNHVLLMIEAVDDCFAGLDDRMKKIRFDDEKRLRGAIKTVTDVTNELKSRSQATLKSLGPNPALARKLKSRAELLKEVKAEAAAAAPAASAPEDDTPVRPPHPMMGGRGGGRGGNPLLAAINAKKKDDDDDDTGRRPNPMGGRGGGNPLMAAIAARKKGGDDGDDAPPARPPNPLMAAIAARKKPDDDSEPPARPVNPLMAAIAARKKPDDDDAPPARPVNPLMAAIAARKKPDDDDTPPARPANPLMAAIAARKKPDDDDDSPPARPANPLMAAIAARKKIE
ncbi:hypothetical protein DYB32_008328 [Aphanomyces invadans]|uniref:C2 domain-containing protein n=1 Tax=Aphanomyces invadans TaxID=157072 RepID=A0A3R7CVN9_9STRA|nr:hypothetical protein DYB32_008328 [Aphanomyces invadans]